MKDRIFQSRAKFYSTVSAVLLVILGAPGLGALGLGALGGARAAQRQGGAGGSAPASAKARAVIDVTGYWVSIVDEDWVWRMMTPAKGDYTSAPLNAEGRRVTDSWDPAKDEAEGNQCKAYGAGGIMRMPARLHIFWVDDNTLEMDIDAGQQKRLFHFDGSKWHGGEPDLQGDSVATWEKQLQRRAGTPFDGPAPGMGGNLHVVTTHMKPGYLEKNGVPYSGNAVLNEHFTVIDLHAVGHAFGRNFAFYANPCTFAVQMLFPTFKRIFHVQCHAHLSHHIPFIRPTLAGFHLTIGHHVGK